CALNADSHCVQPAARNFDCKFQLCACFTLDRTTSNVHSFGERGNCSIFFQLEFRRRNSWYRLICNSHLFVPGNLQCRLDSERQWVTPANINLSTLCHCNKSAPSPDCQLRLQAVIA